jgi:hypothetical protein
MFSWVVWVDLVGGVCRLLGFQATKPAGGDDSDGTDGTDFFNGHGLIGQADVFWLRASRWTFGIAIVFAMPNLLRHPFEMVANGI